MKFRITDLPSFLRHIWRDVDGSSAVELAFIIPVIATLAVGGFDFGRALMESTKVESAARAGAQYAVYDHDNGDDDALEALVVTAAQTDFGSNAVSVTAEVYCHCPSTGAAQQPCQANCSGSGQTPANRYVSVQTDYTYSFTFDYPGLPSSLNMGGNVKMRIR